MTDEEKTEETEDVEAHRASVAGPSHAGPSAARAEDEDDDVEAHGMTHAGPSHAGPSHARSDDEDERPTVA